jgi:hypothetical protein
MRDSKELEISLVFNVSVDISAETLKNKMFAEHILRNFQILVTENSHPSKWSVDRLLFHFRDFYFEQGCQIFLDTTFQNGEKINQTKPKLQ